MLKSYILVNCCNITAAVSFLSQQIVKFMTGGSTQKLQNVSNLCENFVVFQSIPRLQVFKEMQAFFLCIFLT